MNSNWQYLTRAEIDSSKWDRCICDDRNAAVYALSVYLDHTAENWDALILGDYDTVMPLPWKRKYGIRYVYAPYFIQHLGIFGKPVPAEKFASAVTAASTHFKWIDYNVNKGFAAAGGVSQVRTNFILALDRPYKLLREGYSPQCLNNLQKAAGRGCVYDEDVKISEAIDFFRKAYGHLHKADAKDYDRFHQLLAQSSPFFNVMAAGVREIKSMDLLFAGVIIRFKNRLYYALGAPSAKGRNARATYYFIDQLVQQEAGSGKVLDFEGSDIPNVADFYQRFGPEREEYLHITLNNLPWFLRGFKS